MVLKEHMLWGLHIQQICNLAKRHFEEMKQTNKKKKGENKGRNQSHIVQRLLRTLCDAGGKLSVHELIRQVSTSGHTYTSDELKSIAKQLPNVFNIKANTSRYFEDKTETIEAQTNIQVCDVHSTNDGCPSGDSCPKLHICRYYLHHDNCQFDINCKYIHQLDTPHNQEILITSQLIGLNAKQLSVLVKDVAGNLPQICKYYNVGDSSCQMDMSCPAMHICRYYIMDHCAFGQKCNRSHNVFDPQPKQVLISQGIDVKRSPKDVLAELREKFSLLHKSREGIHCLLLRVICHSITCE